MRLPLLVLRLLGAFGVLALAASGCRPKPPPELHFYDQQIQPVFNSFCVGNTSPCHRINPDTKVALGNLDLSSFDNVQKRRDVLRTYGSYPHPLLLLKAVPEASVSIPYRGQLYPSEIRHAGGKPISVTSDAFFELKLWLDAGANRDGIAPTPVPNMGQGMCNTALPPASDRIQVDPSSRSYMDFVLSVQPKLKSSCTFATCHSSPQSDFYITCGDTPDQLAFNYTQAAGFVAPKGTAVEQSEILLRPLSPIAGGVSHTGGTFFQSRDDTDWMTWKGWALEVQDNPLMADVKTAGQQFFEDNVMPKLLQRGCALEGCHSPDGFNDYRLRSGAQGFFAARALRRNYLDTLTEFMALDSVDVRQSRAIKKTIFPESGGMSHRGGALLEDGGASATDACPSPFDPTTNTRAFCIFKEWHRIERQDHATDVSPMTAGSTLPIAAVSRPMNGDGLLDFDNFAGGADLRIGTATLDANGGVTAVTFTGSALTNCAGLSAGTADVRGPEWSYDATKLVFAARPTASSGLDLWLLDTAASPATCTPLTTDGGRLVNGVRVHNFDPVFAPDGNIVFASTRAGTLTLKYFRPNADLYRTRAPMDFSNPEQMTFLLNSEIGPAFMQDGRVSFTAEKATPDFYQLSGRRINWDLTDYHPLLAQRAQSTDTFTADMHPSVGYQQATEIREGLDRNFLIILSDDRALGGGGALATFNRSVGPFQADRTEVTFLKSMVIVDQAATGKDGTAGVYRSPFSLPNGDIMASYAANVTHPTSDIPRYDLVAVAADGTRRMLAPGGAQSLVEAVLGYKRVERALFDNRPQLVFGGHDNATAADDISGTMHFPDVSVLATLLGANLRHGRNFEEFDNAVAVKFYQDMPPPDANAPRIGTEMVFSQRTSLGSATVESDHSLMVRVPARMPLILELIDKDGKSLFTMSEEHQLSAGEYITPGPPRKLFNGICGGCHGSLSGQELDVAVSADALTGASVSASRDSQPKVPN
jgi:hypothetical protein